MRLEEGQIWVHRDALADFKVDKILRVVETHWFSREAICQVRNQYGAEGAKAFSFREIVSDVRWQLANPREMLDAICEYYFKPRAAAKPKPYIEVLSSDGLPVVCIENGAYFRWSEEQLVIYDKSDKITAVFNDESVVGIIKRGEWENDED